jgi:hypothetical protein
MIAASAPASPTARRILAVTRLRARRLALWMEHVWQSGQASPDQGPAIGPGEVSRLLAADSMRAAEVEFFAHGEAATSTLQADVAAAELAADPVWGAVRGVFALSEEEADLLALMVATELDPGLGRVLAYLHDDGRLTQPTPWLAARLAGREPAPFAGAALAARRAGRRSGAGPAPDDAVAGRPRGRALGLRRRLARSRDRRRRDACRARADRGAAVPA